MTSSVGKKLPSGSSAARTVKVNPPSSRGRHAKGRLFVTGGDGVPPSLAKVSHAVAVGGICHTGGQLAITAKGRLLRGSAGEQARLAFKNLLAVLAAGGFSKSELVFVDIALTEIGDLPDVNAEFHRVFSKRPRPARAVLQVAALPLEAKVRLYGIAVRGEESVR